MEDEFPYQVKSTLREDAILAVPMVMLRMTQMMVTMIAMTEVMLVVMFPLRWRM